MLAILLIPGALCYTFGRMIGDTRQGWALLAAMVIVLGTLLASAYLTETVPNPTFAQTGVDTTASADALGANLEGKEVRFGIANSVLWATITTAASNGSVNAMHDSLMPLTGLVPMWLMQLGEVIFGGVGSGLYGMIMFAIIAVFIAGLMIGRTPEYLGKKLGAFEIKMASIAILIPPLLVLVGTAVAVWSTPARPALPTPARRASQRDPVRVLVGGQQQRQRLRGAVGEHALLQHALGIVMLFARYWLAIPVLALAGALAAAKTVPASEGTLPTHTPLFVTVLIGTVITVGALTFVPALALGPVAEHLQLFAGK